MPRPEVLVAVLGTGTEVGKTWVACALARDLAGRGSGVAARKPVQSFEPGQRTDAHELAAATGVEPDEVCPPHRWYPAAYAPPMAAAVLDREPFRVDDLVAELTWPTGVAVGLVEGAGGVRSPLADDGDNLDLVAAIGPDLVVLVADAGLGTVSHTRLAVAALGRPCTVVLNRFDAADDLHRRNAGWLTDRDGFAVATAPAQLAEQVVAVATKVKDLTVE